MAIDIPTIELNNGNKMPQVGFGLWKVDNATCADTVYNAIKTGYRLFDGACGMLQFCSLSMEREGEFQMLDTMIIPSNSVLIIVEARSGKKRCMSIRMIRLESKLRHLRRE
jgi:hypothetical protein